MHPHPLKIRSTKVCMCGWCPRRNHPDQVWCRSVQGFSIPEGLKSGCSIDKASRPYNSSALPCKLWSPGERATIWLNKSVTMHEGARYRCCVLVCCDARFNSINLHWSSSQVRTCSRSCFSRLLASALCEVRSYKDLDCDWLTSSLHNAIITELLDQ